MTAGLAGLLALGLAAGVHARPAAGDLGMTIYLQRQAQLSAAVYCEVRDAVEDGRRPSSDLEAARRSLKAAQTALYDQIDTTQRSTAAVYADLRRQNAQRLKAETILVRAEEAELPTLDAAARPQAEARLTLSREVLEGYRANAARLLAVPAPPPRPKLPSCHPTPDPTARAAANGA